MIVKARIVAEVEFEIPDKFDKLTNADFLHEEFGKWVEMARECDEKVTAALKEKLPGVTVKEVWHVNRTTDGATLYYYA